MESRRDGVIGAAATVLGIAIVAIAQGTSHTFHAGYGPALFPTLIGAGMVICGVVIGVRAAIRPAQAIPRDMTAGPPGPEDRTRALIGVGAVLGSVLFYYLFAGLLGFLITATVIMAGLMWLIWGRPLTSLLIAFASAFLFMQIFAGALRVPLPWGPLLPFSRVLLWM